jgi:enoyl-CoA hydratase/carnithine racemase
MGLSLMTTPESTGSVELSIHGTVGITWGELSFRSASRVNVITEEVAQELLATIREVSDDSALRALVIFGGDICFSGGADLRAIREMSAEQFGRYVETTYAVADAIEAMPQPVVAALNGACVGSGLEIALACDFRVAAQDLRAGFPETSVGFPGPARRLSDYVGRGIATELLLGGRIMGAEEALQLGLVTQVCPPHELRSQSERLVKELAEGAPIAQRVTKSGISMAYASWKKPLSGSERLAALTTFVSEDFREGSASSLERRRPRFSGK